MKLHRIKDIAIRLRMHRACTDDECRNTFHSELKIPFLLYQFTIDIIMTSSKYDSKVLLSFHLIKICARPGRDEYGKTTDETAGRDSSGRDADGRDTKIEEP